MTDAHCHLNFHSFETDYDEVIKRALKAGITRIINAGTSLDSSTKAVEFAEKYPNLYAIVGVHPHHADKLIKSHPEHSEGSSRQDSSASPQNDKNNWLQELEKLTKHPKVIGIGEIGMDYYSYQSNGIVDPKIQREVFEKQIELAYKTGLPFQIHNRHAGIDVIEILTHHKNSFQTVPGMFHCFAGTKEVLKDALNLGFYIGFDGNTLYEGLAPGETVTLSELANLTPLDRMVVETDSPYLTPPPHRGKRNEPAYGMITAAYLAKLKGISLEQFGEQTDKNVSTIFTKL